MASEWPTRKLADLCESVDYGYTASAKDSPCGPRFLRITDIVSGGINWDTVPFCEIDEPARSRCLLHHGDVVVARTGATTGYSAYIASPPDAVFASYLVRLRIAPEASPRFVSYFLKSPRFWSYMRGVMGDKSAQPNASAKTITEVTLPVPPLREQQAIACILGALDDKIELNRRMNRTLEAMARAIFKSWFVDFDPVRAKAAVQREHPNWTDEKVCRAACPDLKPDIAALFPDAFTDSRLGLVPAGWREATLGDVTERPQYGYTASASDEPVGPRYLRITDINKQEWIEWHNVPFCLVEEREQGKYRLKKGDVVIARIADPGHGAMIEEEVEAVFASYLIRFRPRRPELGRFLQYWLRSEDYWNLVRSRQSGTTRANLNAQVLSSFTLVVPQTQLLEAFSRLIDAFRTRLVASVRASRTLAAIRDALLPKLLSGELRVRDAENYARGRR